jgi:hypothetical protein
MSGIRSKLTYANVMSTIAVFGVLGGGTALAAYVVSSNSQIGPGTVSGHKPPTGKHANIIAGSINGTDVADRSGVDTCQTPLTKKFGSICAGSDGGARVFFEALSYCTNLGLRVPTLSEAVALATKYDVPGVGSVETGQHFWTDEGVWHNEYRQDVVDESGFWTDLSDEVQAQTVCVTDPSA